MDRQYVAGRPLAESTRRDDTDVNTRDGRSFAPRDRVSNQTRAAANVISDAASARRRVQKLNGIHRGSRFPSAIADDSRGKIGIARGVRCRATREPRS